MKRVVTQTDVDNSAYSSWIESEKKYTYRGRTMQIGDVIIDAPSDNYTNDIHTTSSFNFSTNSTTSTNNQGDNTFDVTTTIPVDVPVSGGTFIVADGNGGYDDYKYTTLSGTSINLDSIEHPNGLVRTYSGTNAVYITKLREGFTLWIDAVGIGMNPDDPLNTGINFYFGTHANTNNARSWKYISRKNNPVMMCGLRGQLIFTPSSSNGSVCEIAGIPNFYYNPTTKTYQGLHNPFRNSAFLHRSFGAIHWDIDDEAANMMVWEPGENALNASGEFDNYESIGGFAGLRAVQAGNNSADQIPCDIIIRSLYRHDAFEGEGIYVNTTGGDFQASIETLIIENCVLARCATELSQIQDMVNNAKRKIIRNNVGIFGGTDFVNPFQNFQNNGWQHYHGDGNFIFEKNITEGWGGVALMIQGTSTGTGTGIVKYKDNIFKGGSRGVYFHGSLGGLNNLSIEFYRNYFFNKADRRQNEIPGAEPEIDLISSNNGDVILRFQELYKDDSYPQTYENSTDFEILGGGVSSGLTFPTYINAGLNYEVDENMLPLQYKCIFGHTYLALIANPNPRTIDAITSGGTGTEMQITTNGTHKLVDGDSYIVNGAANAQHNGYYQNAVSVVNTTTLVLTGSTYVTDELGGDVADGAKPIFYKENQIVNDSHPTDGIGFWECNADFEVSNWSGQTPNTDVTNWTRVHWDVNGVGSFDVSYNGTPDPVTNGIFPPDNYFIPSDNEWRKKGYGLLKNPIDASESIFQWSPDGIEYVDIPLIDATFEYFKPEVDGFYRCKKTIKNIYNNTTVDIELFGEVLL